MGYTDQISSMLQYQIHLPLNARLERHAHFFFIQCTPLSPFLELPGDVFPLAPAAWTRGFYAVPQVPPPSPITTHPWGTPVPLPSPQEPVNLVIRVPALLRCTGKHHQLLCPTKKLGSLEKAAGVGLTGCFQ